MKLIPAYVAVACLILCLILGAVVRRFPLRRHRLVRYIQLALSVYIVLIILAVVGPRIITPLYAFRPNPPLIERALFKGVDYTREAIDSPEPMVIHVIRINLAEPEIRFFVTPSDTSRGREVRAQTTSDFLQRYGLQLAINADGWHPWWDISPLDFYPHRGDSINIAGFAASEGQIVSDGSTKDTVFLSEENLISLVNPIGPTFNAVPGKNMLLEAGQPSSNEWSDERHPRTVIGLDKTGRILILLLVDGRQQGYSVGASMPELAEIALRYGMNDALNLDGGGSSTLVISDANGAPILLNAPIHNHMPYWERPIANHLGIYAQPLD